MVCRSGLGQEKALLCSSEAADLAAIAIVFQQEPMAGGFGPTNGFVVLMPSPSSRSAGRANNLYCFALMQHYLIVWSFPTVKGVGVLPGVCGVHQCRAPGDRFDGLN